MSGETNSFSERIKKVFEHIDGYAKKVKLVDANVDEDMLSLVLSMSKDDLVSVGEQERSYYAFEISKWSYYIRKTESRLSAVVSWLNTTLSELAIQESPKYCDPKYTKMEEKIILVCANDDVGKIILRRKKEYEAQLESIKDMYRSIEFICRTLQGMK